MGSPGRSYPRICPYLDPEKTFAWHRTSFGHLTLNYRCFLYAQNMTVQPDVSGQVGDSMRTVTPQQILTPITALLAVHILGSVRT